MIKELFTLFAFTIYLSTITFDNLFRNDDISFPLILMFSSNSLILFIMSLGLTFNVLEISLFCFPFL